MSISPIGCAGENGPLINHGEEPPSRDVAPSLDFAQKQVEQIEDCLKKKSGEEERIPLLI